MEWVDVAMSPNTGCERCIGLLRDVSLDEWSGTPESAGRPAPLRRNRSLPVRQRLLSAADSPALDKENAPLLSPAAKLDGSFDFSSPKRASYSDSPASEPAAAAAGQPAHRRPPIRRFLSMVEHPTTDAARAHATLTDRMPVPVPGRVGQFKRPEPPAHEPCSPTRKRLCSLAEASPSPSPSPSPPRAFELQRSESHRLTPVSERVRPLQRCFSESEATIKRAVQRSCQDPDLIGDSTRPYVLPLVHTSRNNDLKAISGETLARLMDGHFDHVVESFEIVDCSLMAATSAAPSTCTPRDGIHERLLANRRALPPPSEADQVADKKRHIVVFHCEFSSERGPSMYRFLREQDRKLNKATYPALLYPEIYLLEGGYKKFFERHLEQCEPRTYKPMNKEGHESDLKHFRAKSKSWAGDCRARGVSKRIFS
ncbi:M-phase inducer phosphatase [Amphibalanus amphitrite]|uniref:protein-tyrosine-phosphatase n=1 Tax=Amphibalanus amphitrite TaxID=1232801 RepID=A0A6A4WYZ3_AMPAM|nr:M-phase inducer phosphatase [Amphibalanus amphitrite]